VNVPFSCHLRFLSSRSSVSNYLYVIFVGRFICTAEFPYGVMYANKSWTRLTGYQQHEIEGKDMCFMQGALTDTVSVIQVLKIPPKPLTSQPQFSVFSIIS
jgi:hypothetical protein